MLDGDKTVPTDNGMSSLDPAHKTFTPLCHAHQARHSIPSWGNLPSATTGDGNTKEKTSLNPYSIKRSKLVLYLSFTTNGDLMKVQRSLVCDQIAGRTTEK